MLERLEEEYVFTIDTGMFRQQIVFCYGADIKNLEANVLEICKPEYRKKARKIFKGLLKGKPFSGLYHAKQPVRIIYVTPQTKLSDFMQIASHEAQHATLEILDYVDIPLGDDSEEAYAYLLGHIMESITYNVFENEGTEEEQIEKELLKDIGLDKKSIEPAKPTVGDVEFFMEALQTLEKEKSNGKTTTDSGPR
jgi:hypothetical protein